MGRAGALVAVWGCAVGFGICAAGCGTSPVGVGACKQVEEARCRRAPACGVSIQPPYSTNGSDVDECIRFYDVQCLHGLAVADPGANAVNACVASIESSPCNAGLPLFETATACDWLTTLPAVEASTEASEADAADADAASDTSDEAPEAESL
jgi:hypothetical protein